MSSYKFDGTYFSDPSGKRLARVDGDYIQDYANSKRIAKIDGDYVIDYDSSRRVARLDSGGVEDYSNSRRVGSFDEIKSKIDGYPSHMQTVALWWYFIR